jgi:hypothetical protein
MSIKILRTIGKEDVPVIVSNGSFSVDRGADFIEEKESQPGPKPTIPLDHIRRKRFEKFYEIISGVAP